MKQSKLNKIHTLQQDQSDCGIACLLSVLKYHCSDASVERLRELSGTSKQGTTLLGLRQAAKKLGLEAEGYEADIPNLKECTDLCILHILKDKRLQHYVVCYGYDEKQEGFLIGDPGEPKVRCLPPTELEKVWQSKTLLLLTPTTKLQSVKTSRSQKWFWLKKLVREDLNILGIALAIGIVVAVLGLTTAIFSQKLIDDILPSKDSFRLFSGAGILLLLLLARSFFGYIRRVFLLRQSKDFNIRILDYFYGRLLHLPKSFFDNRKTGDLIARMNDTQRIQRTISTLFSSVMIDALMVLVTTVAIFVYDRQVGGVMLVWLPVFAFVVYRFHSKIVLGQRAVMAAYAYNESNYVDTIQGIGAIKIANKQGVFTKLTKAVYQLFQQSIFDLGKIGIHFSLSAEIVSTLFIAGVITWSSVNVLNDSLSLGGMIAILQIIGMLMESARRMAIANIQLQEAKVAFERMFEFTSIEGEYEAEAEQPKAKISEFIELKVANLAFRFPGRKRLLKEVSFEVKKGEWIAILGESGCGKSTLLQILQKFYQAEAGSIKANGIDLDLVSFESWRSKLGVVPQQIKIFNGPLLGNILLGEQPDNPERIINFFKYYGFDHYFEKFPNGYATILGEEGINISGGQQQLVALARALFHRPECLLLDEPTSALDRNTELFVLEMFNRLKKEIAIITFTHRLKTAKQADRIYIIENGRVEKQGHHVDLLKSDNLYSRAWNDLVEAWYPSGQVHLAFAQRSQ